VAREDEPDYEGLYLTPETAQQRYGIVCTEPQIRFAMSLIHAHCGRPSLFPETYEERLETYGGNRVILSARPVLALQRAAGRYGYGRRDRQALHPSHLDFTAALVLLGAGFASIDVENIECNPASGECWLPMGLFPVTYSEVQVRYTCGFPSIPERVKAALLEILNAMCAKGVSNRTEYTVGRVSQKYESGGFVSATAKMLLEPYVVRSLY